MWGRGVSCWGDIEPEQTNFSTATKFDRKAIFLFIEIFEEKMGESTAFQIGGMKSSW